jgi:LysR family transcriptional regulator, glycine cleavage system transcriptional activator
MLKRNSPSLVSIRAFEAAARLSSFAKAGDELGMSGAAVSYQIKRLEEFIGRPMFVRRAQGVCLTDHGAAIAPAVIDAFETLRQTFAGAARKESSVIEVTTLPSIGTAWLAPKLPVFEAAHPELTVALDLSVPPADFASAKFDIAIRTGNGHWPGLSAVKLMQNLFAPLCAPARIEQVREALACPDRPFAFRLLGRRAWWQRWFTVNGHANVDLDGRFGTQFEREHLDVAAAANGHGVAIASPLLFASELAAGRVTLATNVVAADERAIWAAYACSRATQPKIRVFREWLVQQAQMPVPKEWDVRTVRE